MDWDQVIASLLESEDEFNTRGRKAETAREARPYYTVAYMCKVLVEALRAGMAPPGHA